MEGFTGNPDTLCGFTDRLNNNKQVELNHDSGFKSSVTESCKANNDYHSTSFEIIDINPCYVTAINSFQYEAVKMTTASLDRSTCEKGKLAQMKANTKQKRCRKPYYIPIRSGLPKQVSMTGDLHRSKSPDQKLSRSHSNRVISLFEDRPFVRNQTLRLFKSRSLDDLRSLDRQAPSMFKNPSSPAVDSDAELDAVSSVLSHLHVHDSSH